MLSDPWTSLAPAGSERLQKEEASDEDEDTEFFDAMEDSPAFITVTTAESSQHRLVADRQVHEVRQTESQTQIGRWRERLRERHRDKQRKDGEKDRETDAQTVSVKWRERNRQTRAHTERQTQRNTRREGQTERQTQTEMREKQRLRDRWKGR